MKKNFSLKSSNRTPERQGDAIKHEIKKYLKRERNKDLPEGVDFWDFNCKIGLTADESKSIVIADISSFIDKTIETKNESFYIEILAKPGHRTPKPQAKKDK